ncbi:gamma-glutamyl-gamma-aminobutyrate hydrolase family protein [Arthrobacter sp. BL-252-APC-1A]|uniref:gamma-glutamyl-gamma-aminobutyrate hydrolase family protein n=1 Tax=Arthrobacter sp. BL-252-APC-1A TaxID=2606622 RepID=UPI001310665D|nr:gamma-glutamyl-gamma-aminobutyrate hydrolase family protein [Arthrobacter sp. BL-252-APC-1A]MSR98344.1 gamma-glutamyl-gamma-aminobutyrate hydrolase family protein [Arthrobacter sp. BL-252-APC-1A]
MALSASDNRGTGRPLIGITTYYQEAAWGVWKGTAALIPGTYVEAVAAAGGIPVLLPPVGTGVHVLDRLDGLVTAGGTDVDPAQYGHQPHRLTISQPQRDAHDLALTKAALERGLPLLAICRGAQILNVALGGTLIQHLPDARSEANYQPAPGVFGEVSFTTTPGSLISSLLGPTASAPCYHHQGIAELGHGLEVTAVAPEGTIEAVELAGSNAWVLGVQFHPEQNPADLRLFRGFVAAAEGSGKPAPGPAAPAAVSTSEGARS